MFRKLHPGGPTGAAIVDTWRREDPYYLPELELSPMGDEKHGCGCGRAANATGEPRVATPTCGCGGGR